MVENKSFPLRSETRHGYLISPLLLLILEAQSMKFVHLEGRALSSACAFSVWESPNQSPQKGRPPPGQGSVIDCPCRGRSHPPTAVPPLGSLGFPLQGDYGAKNGP